MYQKFTISEVKEAHETRALYLIRLDAIAVDATYFLVHSIREVKHFLEQTGHHTGVETIVDSGDTGS